MGNAFYPLTPTQVPEPDTWDGTITKEWDNSSAQQDFMQIPQEGTYEFEITGNIQASRTQLLQMAGMNFLDGQSAGFTMGIIDNAVKLLWKSPLYLTSGSRYGAIRLAPRSGAITATLTLRHRRITL